MTVRFEEGLTLSEEIHLAASPAEVWKLVTDIELPTRFSPELKRVEWLDGATEPAVGARFAGHNENEHVGAWETHSQVVGLEHERRFAWAISVPDGRYGDSSPEAPIATWSFDLVPEDGGTLLRQTVVIGPARSGVTVAIEQNPERAERIAEGRVAMLRGGMRATLEGVRELVSG
ncbi:hypothetical protein GCM10010218_45620 [Streptomyces mashuensis]|uniref:Polyketide cyclase n=1 Tax=Streptomyces mashuensis TaxID=33904 RepID=A0A919B7L4_9ACTN|nr:SRPBCC family protein [Streptomyces mashuensis]GHF59085.1 hypothetical protein GCM10010218_45620 [Streptomyces mashuensis]